MERPVRSATCGECIGEHATPRRKTDIPKMAKVMDTSNSFMIMPIPAVYDVRENALEKMSVWKTFV